MKRESLWKVYEFFKNPSTAPVKVIREYLDPLVQKALEEKRHAGSTESPEDSADSFLRYLAMSTDSELTRPVSFVIKLIVL